VASILSIVFVILELVFTNPVSLGARPPLWRYLLFFTYTGHFSRLLIEVKFG